MQCQQYDCELEIFHINHPRLLKPQWVCFLHSLIFYTVLSSFSFIPELTYKPVDKKHSLPFLLFHLLTCEAILVLHLCSHNFHSLSYKVVFDLSQVGSEFGLRSSCQQNRERTAYSCNLHCTQMTEHFVIPIRRAPPVGQKDLWLKLMK